MDDGDDQRGYPGLDKPITRGGKFVVETNFEEAVDNYHFRYFEDGGVKQNFREIVEKAFNRPVPELLDYLSFLSKRFWDARGKRIASNSGVQMADEPVIEDRFSTPGSSVRDESATVLFSPQDREEEEGTWEMNEFEKFYASLNDSEKLTDVDEHNDVALLYSMVQTVLQHKAEAVTQAIHGHVDKSVEYLREHPEEFTNIVKDKYEFLFRRTGTRKRSKRGGKKRTRENADTSSINHPSSKKQRRRRRQTARSSSFKTGMKDN